MQTHRREEEEEDAGSRVTIRPIVEGEFRESESQGDSPLIMIPCEEETGFDVELAEDFMQGLRLESTAQEHDEEEEGGEEEEEEEEFEFAFVCENHDGSVIAAEEAFENGQIRPFYPVFGRNILLDEDASQSSSSSSSSLVLKGILEDERMGNPSSSEGGDPLEGLAEGTYCIWRKGREAEAGEGREGGACRKSNSTGFSRLWRVKDLVMRSNSDGKDAFVFLNPKKPKENTMTAETSMTATETRPAAKSNGGKAKAATMVARKDGCHSREYPSRSDKNRRRSYLPYRVGFFTNINGMSRNVHPY